MFSNCMKQRVGQLEMFFVKKSNGFEEMAAFHSLDQHCQQYSIKFLTYIGPHGNDISLSCPQVSEDLLRK